MAYSIMFPTNLVLQQQQQAQRQTQQQSLPCQCQCQQQTRTQHNLDLLDLLSPVRHSHSSPSHSIPHTYNLRSLSSDSLSSPPFVRSPLLSPSTDASPSSSLSSIPSLYLGDNADDNVLSLYYNDTHPPSLLDDDYTTMLAERDYPSKDTTLITPQENALGVQLGQQYYQGNPSYTTQYINNNNIPYNNYQITHNTNANANFAGQVPVPTAATANSTTGQYNNIPVPDFQAYQAQSAQAQAQNQWTISSESNNEGSSAIDSTVYQQLQGFNLSAHLLKRQEKKAQQQTTRNTNMVMPPASSSFSSSAASSSPHTPMEGMNMLSSFNGTNAVHVGMQKNSAPSEFDFDMLAASFLNDQVAAFDPAPSAFAATPAFADNNTFFGNLPIYSSPLVVGGMNNKMVNASAATTGSISPPMLLQNAFRTFSSAEGNGMNDMMVMNTSVAPRPTRVQSSSSSSSSSAFAGSPASSGNASPAFDAIGINPSFSFSNSAFTALNTLIDNNNDSSPNFSGIDTPALIPDDGALDALNTSPMWGQLDLGSVSLFPQHQIPQQQQSANNASTQQLFSTTFAISGMNQSQQEATLPTISPKELSLPLSVEKNIITTASPAPISTIKSTTSAPSALKKRVRDSPAFGKDDDDDEDEEETQLAYQPKEISSAAKRARRSASSVPVAASALNFNGTRSTSTAPISLDAPTQSRTYHGPESKTSKRAVPAAAARKVAAIKAQAEKVKHARRSVSIVEPSSSLSGPGASNEEGEGVEEEVEELIEMSIEAKRRQNTIAARRSRQRKAEHLNSLEETIKQLMTANESLKLQNETLQNESQVWKLRALNSGWNQDSRA